MHHPIDDDPGHPLNQAAVSLRAARRVTVLTGAGVSAESGVATFRGAGGLWEGHRIEEVATPTAFRRNPELVWRFYNARRAQLRTVRPNPGHYALVALERHLGDGFTLVTQNVDGLHRAAGSRNVLEVHGSLARVRCSSCDFKRDCPDEVLPELPTCERCGHLLRPDVVWFEEMLPEDVWRAACRATADCQAFLVVGTSAVVYPAAGLIRMAQGVGAAVLEFNLEATAASGAGVLSLFGPSGVLLPQVIERMGLKLPDA